MKVEIPTLQVWTGLVQQRIDQLSDSVTQPYPAQHKERDRWHLKQYREMRKFFDDLHVDLRLEGRSVVEAEGKLVTVVNEVTTAKAIKDWLAGKTKLQCLIRRAWTFMTPQELLAQYPSGHRVFVDVVNRWLGSAYHARRTIGALEKRYGVRMAR